ncbi:ABC transporter permease [Euzebya rosea]|uniref:ABC transporter permease n=1 Tax=Euzebya rosea TaxID=2052804 RepID=UPI000D3EBE4E|nr:ABC transporter permease [Euzebya rosea]
MSTVATGRPTVAGLLLGETRARVTAFVRTPIAAFFTLVFPLVVLLLVGTLVGNAVLESRSGVRIAQFFTPAIAAYAAATAAYTSLAIGLSIDREKGVLRRQRALPIPTAALLGGRVGAGVVSGTAAVVLMVVAGVLFLDVRIVWAKLPAAVLALVVGIGCFAALGFAVSSIARTSAATQAITNGTLVPLAFVSDVFVVGDDMPEALSIVGGLFPLKAFANALAEAFNPFTAGAGFAWSHLALMVAWAAVGAGVATRRWTWDTPRTVSSNRPPVVVGRHTSGSGRSLPPGVSSNRPPVVVGRHTSGPAAGDGRDHEVEEGPVTRWTLVRGQVVDGILATVRVPSSAFFTLALPVVMLLLFSAVFGNPELNDRGGVPLAQHLAPALGIFGMATVTFAELAERLAAQRDRGILVRVRGTPMTLGTFVAGRIGAAVVLGVVTTAVVLLVGVLVVDVTVPLSRLPVAGLVLAVGIATFTVLGLALVAIAPRAEAVSPLANAALLPMAFVSDVFLIGDLPGFLVTIADVLPLRPAVTALSDVLNPALDVGVPWARLGVMLAWAVVAAVVVRQRFGWAPRRT